jgi:hypothetical protein
VIALLTLARGEDPRQAELEVGEHVVPSSDLSPYTRDTRSDYLLTLARGQDLGQAELGVSELLVPSSDLCPYTWGTRIDLPAHPCLGGGPWADQT